LPSDANAHPHLDRSGKLALVHNGIIENYSSLRQKLAKRGHKFLSKPTPKSSRTWWAIIWTKGAQRLDAHARNGFGRHRAGHARGHRHLLPSP